MKKVLAIFTLLLLLTGLVVACGGSSGGGSGTTDVHMTSNNFAVPSVTINKGSSINLISDTSSVHIISNGMWENGTARPTKEPGAPVVNNMQFTSANQSQTIGPFNTAGTFHYYCSVHVGMDLTVIVQ